jgi:hypothetical protein
MWGAICLAATKINGILAGRFILYCHITNICLWCHGPNNKIGGFNFEVSLIFMVYRTVAYLSAQEWVYIVFPNTWLTKTQTNLSQNGECSMALKAVWLHVLCLFSTQQFSLFIQNVEIWGVSGN